MNPSVDPSKAARSGATDALAALLRAQRAELLQVHAALAPQHLHLPQRPEWNLPLWELGHVAWFAERWTLRPSDRHHGHRANPDLPCPSGALADALYDSSAVPHARRWQLTLPGHGTTLALLDAQLQGTLQALAPQPSTDDALYAFRLALLHEAMHLEAAQLLARSLGLPTPLAVAAPPAAGEQTIAAQTVHLGAPAEDPGFAFDNELGTLPVAVDRFRIDTQVRRWHDLLPWLQDAHAWGHDSLWSPAGRAWRTQHPPRSPEALAQLEPQGPADSLNAFEAEAWCAWAGRRLPTEAEWRAAALQGALHWGEVWEWTATPFAPFPGFVAHPYRDYSQPWFDGQHRVLKGASRFTPAVLHSVAFRNFYPPSRSDLVAGVRSVAVH